MLPFQDNYISVGPHSVLPKMPAAPLDGVSTVSTWSEIEPPEPNLSTPRGVARSAPRVVTAGLFCASRPGNYSLLSLWATGGGGEYIVVNRPNCSADPRLAPCQCQPLPREGARLVEGKSWNLDGPSALRSAPRLPASGSVEVAAVKAQALVPLSSSLFIAAHPGPTG